MWWLVAPATTAGSKQPAAAQREVPVITIAPSRGRWRRCGVGSVISVLLVAACDLSSGTALSTSSGSQRPASASDRPQQLAPAYDPATQTAGPTETSSSPSPEPPPGPEAARFASVVAGGRRVCATTTSGRIECWGGSEPPVANEQPLEHDIPRADRRNLGSAATRSRLGTAPQIVLSTSASTTGTTLALTTEHRVLWWGEPLWQPNVQENPGAGDRPFQASPAAVSGLRDVSAIAVGDGRFACALARGGSVSCWGTGYDPSIRPLRLGSVPALVHGVNDGAQLAAGGSHACVLGSDHTVACWGNNFDGQCGGPEALQPVAALVPGLAGATQIALGSRSSCALLQDHTIVCWGALDRPTRYDRSDVRAQPRAVAGIHNATAIALGFSHACALLDDQTVRCWGSNANGELGDGSINSRETPVTVAGLGQVVQVALGVRFSCAVRADHTMACWGDISFLQRDGGRGDETWPTPTTVR